ncbi:hypothetical protein K1X76_07070 [bacterium]|nr:hypothetical protein [bacterium]
MQKALPHTPLEIDQYLKLDCGNFNIIGRGIAGVESVYTLPQFNITFDTGRAPTFSIHHDHLALSHLHLDHAGGLAFYLGLRCLNDLTPLKLIVPATKEQATRDLVEAIRKSSEQQLTCEIIGIKDPIEIKKNIFLTAVENFHCVDSTGYLISEKKKKLKPVYAGLSGNELVELKKKNIEIETETMEPQFAYSGDSKAEFFTTIAAKARVLLMECSFFDDTSNMEKVIKYGHTHINHWLEHLERIESEMVIMTHTSQRYSARDIETTCKKVFPESFLKKLVLFRGD